MPCQRLLIIMFLWAMIIPLASIASVVEGAFVITNHSGRDLEADCGKVSWTIAVGERTFVTAAIDGGLEVLGPKSIKHQHLRQTCRVEAGTCFLSWDPVNVDHHSIGEINSKGDYEWVVDRTGVSLVAQWSTRRSMSELDGRREYETFWQPTSPLLSGATQGMCARTSSPLARAFYSVLLYFRE